MRSFQKVSRLKLYWPKRKWTVNKTFIYFFKIRAELKKYQTSGCIARDENETMNETLIFSKLELSWKIIKVQAVFTKTEICPVSLGCRIHWLHLCRGVRPPNECPGYDTKQSDGEVPAVLELWGMRSTPSLPLLPGPLWPGVVAPDKGPIYGLNRINSILMLK